MRTKNPAPLKPRARSPKTKPTLTAEAMAILAARAALAVKAEDVVVLKVGELVNYTDYMVIASGRSARQAQAIAEKIQRAICDTGLRLIGVEGEREGHWVLIDWGQVIIHVFHHPVREFYQIEKLWGDAPRLQVEDSP